MQKTLDVVDYKALTENHLSLGNEGKGQIVAREVPTRHRDGRWSMLDAMHI